MPLNFALAGKTYDPIEVEVTAEQIAAYAEASADANPRYAPGPDQIAPPVFVVVPAFVPMATVTSDPELGVDNPLMIVHGEQRFVYHQPIAAGSKLSLVPSLESVEDKGRGAIFVIRAAATDPDGVPVVDAYSTIFVRGAGSGTARPESVAVPPPRRIAEAARFSRHVAVDMPTRYAAASGDHNPIHLSEDVATAVGLPGVINHGLGTLSLVAGGLVDELCSGDPNHLRALQVRFTDMVFPGSDVDTTVWKTGEREFVFETARQDGTTVMTGGVECAS